MKSLAISVIEREKVGKSNTRSLRNHGNVPCVLYGGEKQVCLYAHENDFSKIVNTPDVYVVELDINGDATIQYSNLNDNPTTNELRQVTVECKDSNGANSNQPITYISIVNINDPPVVDLNGLNSPGFDYSTSFTENTTPVYVTDRDIQKYIEQELPKLKYRVLHGDLPQQERAASHKAFVDGKAQVLIATDIAARGIDIKDLAWVLNFGLPKTAVYYLHRCGRVGRGGKRGVVYNFVTNFDAKLIGHINDAIKNQSQLDLEFIAKDIKSQRSRPKPKANAKQKQKKKKITKRTKRYG